MMTPCMTTPQSSTTPMEKKFGSLDTMAPAPALTHLLLWPWTAEEIYTSPDPASALGERTAMSRSSMPRRETKSGPLDTKAGAEPSPSSAMSKQMSTSPDAALQMSTRTTQRSSTI